MQKQKTLRLSIKSCEKNQKKELFSNVARANDSNSFKQSELEKGLEKSLAEPDEVKKGVLMSKNEEIRNL